MRPATQRELASALRMALGTLSGLALLFYLILSIGTSQGCSGPQIPRDVIVVTASEIERCGDAWRVTDGWLIEREALERELQEALSQCLAELEAAE